MSATDNPVPTTHPQSPHLDSGDLEVDKGRKRLWHMTSDGRQGGRKLRTLQRRGHDLPAHVAPSPDPTPHTTSPVVSSGNDLSSRSPTPTQSTFAKEKAPETSETMHGDTHDEDDLDMGFGDPDLQMWDEDDSHDNDAAMNEENEHEQGSSLETGGHEHFDATQAGQQSSYIDGGVHVMTREEFEAAQMAGEPIITGWQLPTHPLVPKLEDFEDFNTPGSGVHVTSLRHLHVPGQNPQPVPYPRSQVYPKPQFNSYPRPAGSGGESLRALPWPTPSPGYYGGESFRAPPWPTPSPRYHGESLHAPSQPTSSPEYRGESFPAQTQSTITALHRTFSTLTEAEKRVAYLQLQTVMTTLKPDSVPDQHSSMDVDEHHGRGRAENSGSWDVKLKDATTGPSRSNYVQKAKPSVSGRSSSKAALSPPPFRTAAMKRADAKAKKDAQAKQSGSRATTIPFKPQPSAYQLAQQVLWQQEKDTAKAQQLAEEQVAKRRAEHLAQQKAEQAAARKEAEKHAEARQQLRAELLAQQKADEVAAAERAQKEAQGQVQQPLPEFDPDPVLPAISYGSKSKNPYHMKQVELRTPEVSKIRSVLALCLRLLTDTIDSNHPIIGARQSDVDVFNTSWSRVEDFENWWQHPERPRGTVRIHRTQQRLQQLLLDDPNARRGHLPRELQRIDAAFAEHAGTILWEYGLERLVIDYSTPPDSKMNACMEHLAIFIITTALDHGQLGGLISHHDACVFANRPLVKRVYKHVVFSYLLDQHHDDLRTPDSILTKKEMNRAVSRRVATRDRRATHTHRRQWPRKAQEIMEQQKIHSGEETADSATEIPKHIKMGLTRGHLLFGKILAIREVTGRSKLFMHIVRGIDKVEKAISVSNRTTSSPSLTKDRRVATAGLHPAKFLGFPSDIPLQLIDPDWYNKQEPEIRARYFDAQSCVFPEPPDDTPLTEEWVVKNIIQSRNWCTAEGQVQLQQDADRVYKRYDIPDEDDIEHLLMTASTLKLADEEEEMEPQDDGFDGDDEEDGGDHDRDGGDATMM